MIAVLTGVLVSKSSDHCILDVGGVGFRLAMSSASLSALPAEGERVTVHTHLHVREDELSLFGFDDAEEKRLFEQLIGVSGIGPKVALAVLSALSPGALVTAVATEDVALLSSVPGVGKKTAQRICLELKDKLGVDAGIGAAGGAPPSAATEEALNALVGMGFSSAEASAALRACDGDDDIESLLKGALRRLGGAA